MRFFEFEAREILRREGIPVAGGGFATTAEEAKRIADRLEIHYTPKHGSWLNMAEI